MIVFTKLDTFSPTSLTQAELDAKISLGKKMYEKCKAEEEFYSNDDTRVATLIIEAELDMLERPFASMASIVPKPPTRADKIDALVGFFEMMLNRKRLSKDMEAKLRADTDDWPSSAGDADEALAIATILLGSWALRPISDELLDLHRTRDCIWVHKDSPYAREYLGA